MYKQLCTDGLGVSVRQNELIELALTYGFRSIEIDMEDMVGRAESMGLQFATQFVNSASVEIGTFRLPMDLGATEDAFAKQQDRLDLICELAQKIDAHRCFANIAPTHPALPYVENFEQHRTRITALAERLAQVDITIGLKLNAHWTPNDDMQFIHKADEILALVKTIDKPNVGLVLDSWNWQVGEGLMDQIRQLDVSMITEVRLADPPEGLDSKTIEPVRNVPGTHPASIAMDLLSWLREAEFGGPVALTSFVEKSTENPNDNLFHRINKVFERLLAGEVEETAEPVETQDEPTEAVSTAAE